VVDQAWRFIPPLQTSGKVQMALDTWLLDQHAQGLSPPVLRFYTWSPPAISLGYHQRHWPQTWNQLLWAGQPVEVVRRPTGGRAVLHHGDLTYAVITSGLGENRLKVYQKICEFLIQGWRSLGVELHYGQAQRGYIHNPNCFDSATAADLCLTDGSKLIGSAQVWRGSTVLQQGSMQLKPDPELWLQVFSSLSCTSRPLEQQGKTLIAALTAAASQCFHTQLQVQPLSAAEWQSVRAIIPQVKARHGAQDRRRMPATKP